MSGAAVVVWFHRSCGLAQQNLCRKLNSNAFVLREVVGQFALETVEHVHDILLPPFNPFGTFTAKVATIVLNEVWLKALLSLTLM
jgi:hypothetical protein